MWDDVNCGSLFVEKSNNNNNNNKNNNNNNGANAVHLESSTLMCFLLLSITYLKMQLNNTILGLKDSGGFGSPTCTSTSMHMSNAIKCQLNAISTSVELLHISTSVHSLQWTYHASYLLYNPLTFSCLVFSLSLSLSLSLSYPLPTNLHPLLYFPCTVDYLTHSVFRLHVRFVS